MEERDYILQALSDIRQQQSEGFGRMDAGFATMNGRVREAEREIAVLKDRSNRAETSAQRTSWWGKGGAAASLVSILPHLKDLLFSK